MSLNIDRLRNRTSKLEEDELLKIAFTNSHEYHQAAVEAAREELSRRGYTVEVVITKPTGGEATIPPLPPLPKPPPAIQETEAEAIQEKEAAQKTKGEERKSDDKRSRRKILSALGTVAFFLVVVIAGAVGKGCGHKLFQIFTQEKTYTNSNASWARRKISDMGVSIDLPGEPSPKEVTLPPQAKGMIRSHKSYGYNEGGLSVGVSHVVYADHITANPEGGARGSFETIRGSEGITNLQYSITPQGNDRVIGNGSYTRFGRIVNEISTLVIASDNKAWTVLIVHERSNTDAAIASKRILESVLVESTKNGSR